jgi:hypothetical protein
MSSHGIDYEDVDVFVTDAPKESLGVYNVFYSDSLPGHSRFRGVMGSLVEWFAAFRKIPLEATSGLSTIQRFLKDLFAVVPPRQFLAYVVFQSLFATHRAVTTMLTTTMLGAVSVEVSIVCPLTCFGAD